MNKPKDPYARTTRVNGTVPDSESKKTPTTTGEMGMSGGTVDPSGYLEPSVGPAFPTDPEAGGLDNVSLSGPENARVKDEDDHRASMGRLDEDDRSVRESTYGTGGGRQGIGKPREHSAEGPQEARRTEGEP